jgi:hypothetical protein
MGESAPLGAVFQLARGRAVRGLVSLVVFVAPAAGTAAGPADRYVASLRPGLLRLERLDKASNKPCVQDRFALCAASARAEAAAARSLSRGLARESVPRLLVSANARLQRGLRALALVLDEAARLSDKRDGNGLYQLTRAFVKAFIDLDRGILQIDKAVPSAKLPTFPP